MKYLVLPAGLYPSPLTLLPMRNLCKAAWEEIK